MWMVTSGAHVLGVTNARVQTVQSSQRHHRGKQRTVAYIRRIKKIFTSLSRHPNASQRGKHPTSTFHDRWKRKVIKRHASNVLELLVSLNTAHGWATICYQCNGFTSIKTVTNHSRTAAKRTTTQDPIDIEHLPLVKIQMFAFNIQKCRVGN